MFNALIIYSTLKIYLQTYLHAFIILDTNNTCPAAKVLEIEREIHRKER